MKIAFCLVLAFLVYVTAHGQDYFVSDYIYWEKGHKLELADFKGEVDSAGLMEFNRRKAIRKRITDSIIANNIHPASELFYPTYSKKLNFDSLHAVIELLGGYFVSKDSFSYKVKYSIATSFNMKASYTVARTSVAIEAAQVQFDIYELHTRKIRKFLSETTIEHAYKAYLDGEVVMMRTFCAQDVDDFKKELKRSVCQGCVIKKWREKITKEIEALEDFKEKNGVFRVK